MSQTVKCTSCGEQSTESDFCSHCGTQLSPSNSGAVTPAPAATTAAEHCPKCTAEREDPTSPFCGTCGYNFVTKQGGEVVQPDQPEAAAPVKTASAPVTTSAPVLSGPRIDIVITVDTKVGGAPKGRPALTFPLYDEESLIGRKSTSVKQTVSIEDDACSKRHALIVRNADGSYIIRDLQSTNGTSVNGKPLTAGADEPIKEGDVIRMGEFTIITVQAIRLS